VFLGYKPGGDRYKQRLFYEIKVPASLQEKLGSAGGALGSGLSSGKLAQLPASAVAAGSMLAGRAAVAVVECCCAGGDSVCVWHVANTLQCSALEGDCCMLAQSYVAAAKSRVYECATACFCKQGLPLATSLVRVITDQFIL
jgi:hypothetical protein